MAEESTTLKAALLAAFQAQIDSTDEQPGPITELSEDFSQAIVDAIKTAIDGTTVTFALVAPNGPVTGTITLTSTAT